MSCAVCVSQQIVPNFRVRTIPVLGTAPAIFGMAAAAHILCELAAAPFSGEPIIQLTGQQYERALTRLQQREEEVFGNTGAVPVDKDDVSGWCWPCRKCLLTRMLVALCGGQTGQPAPARLLLLLSAHIGCACLPAACRTSQLIRS